jgi:hypothetical protein
MFYRSSLFGVFAALAALSCNADLADGNPCHAIVHAMCDRLERCNLLPAGASDSASCQDQNNGLPFNADCNYSGGDARTCASDIDSATCDSVAAPDSCASAFGSSDPFSHSDTPTLSWVSGPPTTAASNGGTSSFGGGGFGGTESSHAGSGAGGFGGRATGVGASGGATSQAGASAAGGSPNVSDCDSLTSEFSSMGSNPQGAWSYGWMGKLGSAFNLYGSFYTFESDIAPGDPNLVGWSVTGSGSTPLAAFNPNFVSVHAGVGAGFPEGTYVVPAHETDFHPGSAGEYSIARWTASRFGSITIKATFQGQSGFDGSPVTTTDVHVLHNGADVVSSVQLNSAGTGNSFTATPQATVFAGDTVDFAVGFGNFSNGYDSTQVDASVCWSN